MEDDEFGGQNSGRLPGRRSARNAASRSTAGDNWGEWRGERRSSRLGAPPEIQLDRMQLDDIDQPPAKRARTEESTASASSDFGLSQTGSMRGDSSSTTNKPSAAAIKPGEIKLEKVQGKKGSKFWFYAVETIPGHPTGQDTNGAAVSASEMNGHVGNGKAMNGHDTDEHLKPPDKEDDAERKMSPDSMSF